MIRKQIYLSPSETQSLALLATQSGRKQSEIIREAIRLYLEKWSNRERLCKLQAARGIWNDQEKTSLHQLRSDFERSEHAG